MFTPTIHATQALRTQSTLGEGPLWDPEKNAFWWIDIIEKKLHLFDSASQQNRTWQLDQMPGTVVTCQSGGLALALENGFARFDPTTEELKFLGDPESDLPENRFNDGKCDPQGRFWAGTMRTEDHMEQFTGSLYSLELDGEVIKRLGSKIGVSNGIVWSSDSHHMYFIDSPTRHIYRFDYDPMTGEIRNRQIIFEAPEGFGFPDGMAIDSEDHLWVAFWGGGCVAKIDPSNGKITERVIVPVTAPTACAFGGPNLNQLLITTASLGLDQDSRDNQPMAGDLFIAEVSATGVIPAQYRG
ncbi:MAG: SMP-30/gluconolactonase/LRE family protein [Mariniblastus sp.]|nr:SMP-30/gluconolactonase/LRE family protein [Mariniblastus sp.]